MILELLRQHLTLAQRGLLSTHRFPTWLDEQRREARMLEIFEALGARSTPWTERQSASFVESWIFEMSAAALWTGKAGDDEIYLERAVRRVIAGEAEVFLENSPRELEGVRGARRSEVEWRAFATVKAARAALRSIDLGRYADELQLVRRTADGVQVRHAGEIALSLRGRDLLRWLLALETTLSSGDGDPWRISVARARGLALASLERVGRWEEPAVPWDYPGFERLTALGLAAQLIEQWETLFEVTPLGHELFGELDQPGGAAMASLARAVLGDEVRRVLQGRQPVVSELEGLVRHTRMMAHELRNALVPVQFAVKEVRRGTSSVATLDLIDRGLDRALRFVTDAARIAGVGALLTENFAVDAAVRDAVSSVSSELENRIELDVHAGVERVRLRGRRDQLVLALINLVRNAAQVGGVSVRIFVTCEATEGQYERHVVVRVEDDGPGVEPGYEAEIFADGVSLRAGGTGHGLAFVREVVEVEFKGAASCDRSPRGGARFTLRLPISQGGET